MKHLKTPQQLNEASENLNISDVSNSNSKEIHIIDCYFNSDEIDIEDGGQAKIFTASKDDLDNGMFVRVCSWDENKNHEDFKKFVGRRIKITIETID
jgi:hypothetical protein